MKWKRVLLLTLMTVCLISSSISIQSESIKFVDDKSVDESRIQIGSYKTETLAVHSSIFHEPIYIISDENFTDYGFPGYGNITHPYIIENFHINDTWQGTAIHVQDTTRYFEIRNCYLNTESYGIVVQDVSNGTASLIDNYCEDSAGIYLTNATESKILGNTCTISSHFGIEADYSHFLEIENNTCFDLSFSGINLYKCNYSLIRGNNCSFSEREGIDLSHCYNTIIENNTFSSNKDYSSKSANGIEMYECKYVGIIDNFIENNDGGLELSNCEVIWVINNSFSFNLGFYGVYNRYSDYCMFMNNTFYKNGFGMRIYGNDCLIKFNQFQENRFYGIYFHENSSQNLVYYNYFMFNNIEGHYGGTTQASDYNGTNFWFEEESKIGNWWSDLGVKRKYKIDGEANAKDIYPINKVNFSLDKILATILIPSISIAIIILVIKYAIPTFVKK